MPRKKAAKLDHPMIDPYAETAAFEAACDWIRKTFPNGEERYPHYTMIQVALRAYLESEKQENKR